MGTLPYWAENRQRSQVVSVQHLGESRKTLYPLIKIVETLSRYSFFFGGGEADNYRKGPHSLLFCSDWQQRNTAGTNCILINGIGIAQIRALRVNKLSYIKKKKSKKVKFNSKPIHVAPLALNTQWALIWSSYNLDLFAAWMCYPCSFSKGIAMLHAQQQARPNSPKPQTSAWGAMLPLLLFRKWK